MALKICMDWNWCGAERTRNQNDFCFLIRRRERQCPYARSVFLFYFILLFNLRHFDRGRRRKKYFLFVRFDTT